MDQLLNSLKRFSAAQDASVAQPRFGRITSVNPDLATVRVELQPEGVLSGWLPVLSCWTGNGWGLTSPLSPGDQVLVLPQEGDAENGVVVGSLWSDSAPAPKTPVGELWLTHRSGSCLQLRNDGTIAIKGDLHVDGDVFDRTGPLSSLRSTYNQHTHTDSRGGQTSQPSPQDNGSKAANV